MSETRWHRHKAWHRVAELSVMIQIPRRAPGDAIHPSSDPPRVLLTLAIHSLFLCVLAINLTEGDENRGPDPRIIHREVTSEVLSSVQRIDGSFPRIHASARSMITRSCPARRRISGGGVSLPALSLRYSFPRYFRSAEWAQIVGGPNSLFTC